MKLAFIQAPAWGRDCPPYTMCYFAAMLRRNGYQVHLFDLNNILYHTSPISLRKMWDDKDFYAYWEDKETVNFLLVSNRKALDYHIDRILSSEAKIICFTVHFSSAWASLEIAKRIKERDSSRIIVFGGPDCSRQLKGDYFIRQDAVDIVVHGEGELPLFEIIERIRHSEELHDIKGCLTLRQGAIIDGGYLSGASDLDRLPIPDYSDFRDDINMGLYREPYRLDIFDSQGCPTHCHFCSEWQFWGKFRAKSGKRLYKEVIQHMKDFPQVDYFYFIGSLVNGDMQALEEFCDLVVSHKLKIRWAGQAVIREEMNEQFLKKMKDSGCVWLSYGIESGSQRVLDKMNKRFSLDTASRVLKATKKAGIALQANFMFGLPTETREEFGLTLNFLRNNREYMDTILASQSFCVIDKGTYLYNHPEEFGIKDRKHHLYWESNNGENNYSERLRRYEQFCQLALSLGVPETSGVLKDKPDKWQLLGDYYSYKHDYKLALENYLKAKDSEAVNRTLLSKIARCCEEIGTFDRAIESLNDSLRLKGAVGNNGASNENIQNKLTYLSGILDILKAVSNGGLEQSDLNFSFIDSERLAKILWYFSAVEYKGVNLEKILSDFNFGEKQKSMSRILYSHGLWVKLSNFILADVQRLRKEEFLYSYPYWLVIDPCNLCNLSCPFCPTGQKRNVRSKGKLSFNDFKNIVDKLGPYLIHIDLVNWGEPFFNKEIFGMVKYAKQFHCDIKVDTNLHYLDEAGAEKLTLSNLDKLVVSIDGLTQETYSHYRKGGNLELVMNNLKTLLKKRKELKSTKPYIVWQFLVFRHNEHEVKAAMKMGRKMGVNHVGISKAFIGEKDWIPLNPEYSNYNTKEITDNDLTHNHFKSDPNAFCHWPWQAIAINTNTSVSVCCSVEEEKEDFCYFFDQPFEELWNGEEYQVARKYIRDKVQHGSDNKNICIGCKHLGLINVDILSCHSFFDLGNL